MFFNSRIIILFLTFLPVSVKIRTCSQILTLNWHSILSQSISEAETMAERKTDGIMSLNVKNLLVLELLWKDKL